MTHKEGPWSRPNHCIRLDHATEVCGIGHRQYPRGPLYHAHEGLGWDIWLIDRQPPHTIRRAFGSALRSREASRDLRVLPWLDSLRAGAVFGWRQIVKRKVTSAAAILSLALAIGACTSALTGKGVTSLGLRSS